MSDVNDKLCDHEYDGIKEFDNPLPGWWRALFYLTIVWAVIYAPYYWLGFGDNQIESYQQEMAEAAAVAAAAPAPKPVAADTLAEAETDPARIAAGSATYTKLCFACHATGGAGLVGPNLTDDYWLHGGSMKDVVHVITEGVPEKGMIAWKSQLTPDEIISAAAYIKSLRGTNPANPKAPQGEKIE